MEELEESGGRPLSRILADWRDAQRAADETGPSAELTARVEALRREHGEAIARRGDESKALARSPRLQLDR